MTRGVLCAAGVVGLAAAVPAAPALAQVDTTARRDSIARDTSARRDTTQRDTAPAYLPVFARPTPAGPLPAGTRYVFTADSFAFSGAQTLSDLLAHVPGVYVARGGIYGQAEVVMYGGRGPAGLEVYWDGVPYLPIGRDSVWLDPARIALAPLERVEVLVLPATLRVYLVTRRQSSTVIASEVGLASGQAGTANYRGAYLRRWRSGIGLSLVADYNNNDGIFGTSSSAFSSVDLWVNAEYLPNPHLGASYQVLASSWKRDASGTGQTDHFVYQRRDAMLRLFVAARADGLGPSAHLTFASATASHDSAVANRSLAQSSIELRDVGPRAAASLAFRSGDEARPWRLEAAGSWTPLPMLTLAGDARRAGYSRGRDGERAHLAAGLALPLGFSLHGDAAWARDLQAPVDTEDAAQRTADLAGALRWERDWITLEAGGGVRDAFAPIGMASGLKPIAGLGDVPRTHYVSAHAAVRLLPGLTLAGWYFDPQRVAGNPFEPPYHARLSLTFYSKFWRVYRSGIFALRGEGALESWSRGTAGVDSTGAPVTLPGATFADLDVELRIAGVTIFWIQRNANLFRGSYVPGLDYPRRYQFYGVRWVFAN